MALLEATGKSFRWTKGPAKTEKIEDRRKMLIVLVRSMNHEKVNSAKHI